ncbi:P-type conjugative transfer protein VirB9 [Neorickettsia findlayensis]|nr:P-type conjugative transfer protein VirB9 [Neorickettsia findlayensis]
MMTIRELFFIVFFALFCIQAHAIEHDPRMRTLVYSESAVFRVDTSYGYQSFIKFSDREQIKTIALGNSVGWSVNPVGEKIFLRPLEKGLSTNMVVVTDKRTYVFDLLSASEDDEKKRKASETNYMVRFQYPDEISSDASNMGELSVGGRLYELDYSSLRRNYSFGGKADFQLKEVMNNLGLTFFRFEGSNIPRVFIVNSDRSESRAKMWRFRDYVVIEGVHKKLHLRYKDSMLEVVNNDLE